MQQPVISQTGFLRVWQIVGCRKRGAAPLIPISPSAWWQGIREGRYPKGILLGPRTRVWTAESILKLIADTSEAAQ
jgi:prophage regulatory protein